VKIDESKLPKLLKFVSFLSLLFVFTTFFCVLILEFNMVDRWKYAIDYFVGLLVFLNFAIGCVGASILFCNLSAVRSLRPDFALLVFICWLPVAILQYVYGVQNFSFAPFNDITTNTANPPQFRLSRSERQIHVGGFDLWGALQASDKIAAHPGISSITFLALPDLVYECALRTAYALNWKVTIRDPVARVFEVKATLAHINKAADAVIRVVDTSDGYSIVDVRSTSPNNRIDGGFNAQIIKSFVKPLKRMLVNRRMLNRC
jgi:hypothetical protein